MTAARARHGRAIQAHDAGGDLAARILAAACAAGLDVEHLGPDDLAAVDEFHIRGREATRELAELAGLTAGQRVLDVGCGLGGSARYLAARHRVRVTGVDRDAECCRVGRMLSERTGLAGRVELLTADALEIPFADGSFDVVWSEHAAMSIADKPGFYGELRRVLRTGGRLVLYDVLAGRGGELRCPVPWAPRPELSFLVSPARLRTLLEQSAFEVAAWKDLTAGTLDWYRRRAAALDDEPPPLGTHLLMGPDAREMLVNLVRNLAGDRITVVQVRAEVR